MFGRKKKTEEHHSVDPLEHILDSLDSCLQIKTEIRDKKLFCPEWDIEITPEIDNLTDQSAVLNFYVSCPEWDEPLFECCAGMGKDRNTAIGTAVSSFLFAFMHGIEAMETNQDSVPLESEFAGKTHRWKVYKSNIVGMGENMGLDNFNRYWNALKDGITKRLGNQRMCYIKVYAAKGIGADGEYITGECRVNDVPSVELGKIVYDIAAEFDVEQFASQKLFFFIKQDSQTLLPYPYRMNKIPMLREKVKIALEMFNKCDSEEEYNALLGNMVEALDDGPLAEECFCFLPEICAEHAFNEIQYSEQVQFSIGGAEAVTVYKNQLADFFPLGNLMFGIFDSGYFGEQTNELYRKLINCSAIAAMVSKLKEDKRDLTGLSMTALLFNMAKQFEIR